MIESCLHKVDCKIDEEIFYNSLPRTKKSTANAKVESGNLAMLVIVLNTHKCTGVSSSQYIKFLRPRA